MKTHLFLLGGSPAYQVYADRFVAAAGGADAVIAVLVQSYSGWLKYGDEIILPWVERGVSRFVPLAPGEDGVLDLERTLQGLKSAGGIFIGGGNTPTYHRLFATGIVRIAIQERYRAGVPVAGVSAGALISLNACPLTPNETGAGELRLVEGLCLASGFTVGVHYTERNALPEMLAVMAETKTSTGYGVDEPAGIECENGRFIRALGKSVYRVEMTDFEHRVYQIERL